MLCSSCGTTVAANARFCSNCGQELTRRADERRIVTVLFADIVGFTSLSETRDPEHVKNLVDQCFALLADNITAFGGRVDKVVGDAIIALFGAPVTHEDDAERAVRAALRMQETVKRHDERLQAGIRLRIGVNTGEVLVGSMRAANDYTAMGDVVNTASRLQSETDPGTVLVGPATHAETNTVIRYGSEGESRVRGRDEPISVWRAIEPIGRPGERRGGRATPLLGREPELTLVRRAVASAFGRERAHLISLHGETGVGKSRLAMEIGDRARTEHDALVLAGRCLPYGEANVWWPIAEALRVAIGVDVDASPDDARQGVAAAVARELDVDGGNRIDSTTEGLLHLLGHPSRLDGLDAMRAGDESALAARAYLYHLSGRQKVLLWLADLQWADDAVLRFVDDTLERLARRRFVMLATGASELAERWSPRAARHNAVSIMLEPLGDDASQCLLDELLDGDTDPELRRDLVTKAGGNPMFLHEMARMVAEGTPRDSLPGNIRSVIGARLDGLDDDVRGLLEDAAVLGLRGTVPALERMAYEVRGVDNIQGGLVRLSVDGLLDVAEGRWSFRSSLVRDVSYERLTKTDRAWRHAGIANAIEEATDKRPESVAYHYRTAASLALDLGGVSGLPEDLTDRAVDWTLRATRSISGDRAPERTRQLYSEALDLLTDDDPRRATLLLERARTEVARLQLGAARRDIASAAPLVRESTDVRLEVALALVESELAQWEGDFDRALERSAAALELVAALDDPILAGDALRRCGMVQLFLGREIEAEDSISAAYDAYARGHDARGEAWARQNLAWISFVRGRLVEAEERLDEAITSFGDLGDPGGAAWSRGLLAYVRIYEGRFAEAEELADRTLIDARDRGDSWGEGMMIVALGTVALWTGRVDEAVERAQAAYTMLKDAPYPLGTIQSVSLLGRSLVRSGRVAEGLASFSRSRVGDAGDHGAFELLFTAGMAASATAGDTDAGRRFGAGRRHETFDDNILGHSDRAVASALVALQEGDLGGAVELLEKLPGIDEPSGSTWGWSVSALAATAVDDDPGPFIDAVAGSTRSTYGDRVLSRLADACWRAANGDEAATRAALAQAEASIPEGGDRLHPLIVAIAAAECLRAVGGSDAGTARERADQMAAEIGIDVDGWRTAFETVLARSRPGSAPRS